MKNIIKNIIYYETSVKSFVNLYELKCNLPGNIRNKSIRVRKDLYPKWIDSIDAIPSKKEIIFDIWFITEYGPYITNLHINLKTGLVRIIFNPFCFNPKTNNLNQENLLIWLSDEDYVTLFNKCKPIVVSFLDNLKSIKNNYPCSNDCYYKNQKDINNKCDKMYISLSEHTPEKNKIRQQIVLGKKEFDKQNAYALRGFLE